MFLLVFPCVDVVFYVVFVVQNHPKNRSGEVPGASGGVRGVSRLGSRGDPDQILNDFKLPLGFHFGSFRVDFSYFFIVVLQVSQDTFFPCVFDDFEHNN